MLKKCLFFAQFCHFWIKNFQKHEKFWPEFGVCSTQLLVKIYNIASNKPSSDSRISPNSFMFINVCSAVRYAKIVLKHEESIVGSCFDCYLQFKLNELALELSSTNLFRWYKLNWKSITVVVMHHNNGLSRDLLCGYQDYSQYNLFKLLDLDKLLNCPPAGGC